MEPKLEHILVDIPGSEYDVLIASNLTKKMAGWLSKKTKNRNVLVVTDEFFSPGYTTDLESALVELGFNVHKFVMKGGKISKSFNEVLKIYGVLEKNDFARDSVLVALGGGVIGDLAGFVASTWYRGMYLVHVPTTLMAMVDSSIGGKVAINYRDTINAVGNYYHPVANFMDVEFLDTLPERDYISGLAEVIKCAYIADANFIQYLQDNRKRILNRNIDALSFCIKRAIEIKVDHIRHDVKEGGMRLLLNYGHTLGHAIEMATHGIKGETFRHGEGVSLGISAALTMSERHLSLPRSTISQCRKLLEDFKLPVAFSASEFGYERMRLVDLCMKLILKDKKRKDNQLRFILMDEPGKAGVYTAVPDAQVRDAFESVICE
jgi:3-dehydroquinate synthase